MDSVVITITGAVFFVLLLTAGVSTAQRAAGKPLLVEEKKQRSPVAVLSTVSVTPTRSESPSPTARPPGASPTPVALPEAVTATATPARRQTATPNTPLGVPSPTPEASMHFWLERPIGPDGVNYVARFYPYGSTGEGKYEVHHGVEFVNPEGTSVRAVAAGDIIFAGTDDEFAIGPTTDFYGNVVVQELDDRWQSKSVYVVYGHLSTIAVEEGDEVEAGDQIGLVGASGIALGPHLHLEVRVGENAYTSTRNPQLWLRPRPGRGIVVGQVLDVEAQPVHETVVSLHEPDSEAVQLYEYTYAEGTINPDEEWNENLVMGDVPAGEYRIAARIGDQTIASFITVPDGGIAFARLQALPASPEGTSTPTLTPVADAPSPTPNPTNGDADD